MFGPSCSVTISREGRSLSRQLQEAQGGQDTADVKEVRQQLRQLEKAEREKEEEEYGKKQKNAEETEKANEIAEEIERVQKSPVDSIANDFLLRKFPRFIILPSYDDNRKVLLESIGR